MWMSVGGEEKRRMLCSSTEMFQLVLNAESQYSKGVLWVVCVFEV